jgi:hypothetical protein
MEENKNSSERLIDAVSGWIKTYRSLVKIRIAEHASQGVSLSIVSILVVLAIVFMLFFIGLGAAWWIGENLENMKAGFFIVGGVYTIVLVFILVLAKRHLIPGIRNIIIKKIYEQD